MKPKEFRKNSSIIGSIVWFLFFILMGCFFLGLGAVFNDFQPPDNYESAEATVTKWIPSSDPYSPTWCPVYEFTTKKGEQRSFTGKSCVNKPDPATVGKMQQEIYYDPTNPYTQVFETENKTRSWMLDFGIGMAIFFWLLGIITFSISMIKRRNNASPN